MNTNMDFSVRIMKIDRLIQEKGVVTFEDLQRATGAAPATVKRDIRYMREHLKSPITYSRARGGYLFAKSRAEALRDDFYERRSSWFTPDELYCSVKTLQQFEELEKNRRGFLTKELGQVAARLRSAMFEEEANVEELKRRVHIQEPVRKPIKNEYFEVIGQALVHRHRARIRYYAENSGEETERIVSPVRLTYYRGCWYLDAYCHLRNEIRSFNVENIRYADMMQTGVKPVPIKQVDIALGAAYGMFRGQELKYARIRFKGAAAKRASRYIWHPDQVETWMDENTYELVLPFASDSPELIGDLMRYGKGCEVVEPASLRDAFKKEVQATLALYE